MAEKRSYHDPFPNTLEAVREDIDYWATRQGEGHPESVHEVNVKNRLEHLRELERRLEGERPKTAQKVFISCGQVTPAELQLGNSVSDLVRRLTPYEPYFAQNQSSLEGLSRNILDALNDAVGLIAIMHARGKVVSFDGKEHTRASVWIEQEIAIAAFVTQALKRPIHVKAYIHADIKREGMRDQLHLNPIAFSQNEEILRDLETVLPEWRSTMHQETLSAWQPDARIENADHENSLVLKSDVEFKLRRVWLAEAAGALLSELKKPPEWDIVQSRGFRVPIPRESLTEVWNNSSGPRDNRARAVIGYELSAGGQRRKFDLPILLTQEFYVEGSAHTAWIKATG